MDPVHVVLATFATLFPITNPLGNAAIFASLTELDSPRQRNSQALKGSCYAWLILTVFYFAGSAIMHFFDLSLEGVRIAGGLLISKLAFDLLNPDSDSRHSDEEHEAAKAKQDISFSPLAMPLLAGPGSMATVMGMSSLSPEVTLFHHLAVVTGISVVCVVCWLMLRASAAIINRLGVNMANALTRIMGFLLLCIGVQLVITAVQQLTA